MASSNIILILLYLSPFYRTYYKATIKSSTSVKRGYYKALHTRLSDNCITFAMSHSVDWATFIDKIYPVGSIYMSVNNVSPQSFIGGTWVAWGAGRVPVGVDPNDTSFDTAEEKGGEKTHTLTVSEIPSHNHGAYYTGSSTSDKYYNWYGAAGNAMTYDAINTGGGGAHNNLQPYITCYMWKRTA